MYVNACLINYWIFHSPPTIRSRENKDSFFVYPGGEKEEVKIPSIKANIYIYFKSKNTLFDSYIMRF